MDTIIRVGLTIICICVLAFGGCTNHNDIGAEEKDTTLSMTKKETDEVQIMTDEIKSKAIENNYVIGADEVLSITYEKSSYDNYEHHDVHIDSEEEKELKELLNKALANLSEDILKEDFEEFFLVKVNDIVIQINANGNYPKMKNMTYLLIFDEKRDKTIGTYVSRRIVEILNNNRK